MTTESLNPTENTAFSTFKKLCTEQGLTKQPDEFGNGDVSDGINDEVTLYRFLQARKFNPSEALNQYKQARTFHTEKDILRLYELISVDDYEDTRRLYPHWTGRRDKTGLPITMIDVAHLNNAALNHWRRTRDSPSTGPDMAQRACVFQDTMIRFILPLCTAMRDRPDSSKPVTNTVLVADVSDVSLRQAWDLRDFAENVSWILATCYPDTIKYIFACNVPSFVPMLWNVFKSFIDPPTAEKIVMLRSTEVYPTLSKHIEHHSIPVQFGGAFKFENGMLPEVDGDTCKMLGWDDTGTRLPSGPVKWVQDGDGDGGGKRRKAVATGSIGGVQRYQEIATLDVPA